ncbi:siderophore-interacting protein [Asaia krungthepensis]|uniref:Siderophore-interacting protein n=1 Tax=Asaia krungthepensis NRIC 0535 TaxID=1307925 RepID=A0ABQ0Q664_9PROT|nr:siderophore-interacting protein [Asaia krungthepensis]GBQ93232.1 siderophore-interacting protein [Asaia krungthepensis NRIC 0535]
MSTISPGNGSDRLPTKIRHPLRLRRIAVSHVVPLSQTMRRIVFSGEDLHDFVTAGVDDHVKLFFPRPGMTEPVLPDLSADRSAPRHPDVIARDYTPRRFDPENRELTIDFVLHEIGPATEWAAQARPGHVLGMGGPKASHIAPRAFRNHLLIGDDTALPAVARTLESLPPDHSAIVALDTGETDRTYPLPSHARVDIHRCDRASGQSLAGLVRLIVLPPAETLNVWIAAEIEQVRTLRDHLVNEEAIPRAQIRAAGYWRRDHAAGGARLDD